MRGVGQKAKLITLERILLRETDLNHPMMVQEIVEALREEGIDAERKSIYDDMAALRDLGMDICSQKGKNPGWFVRDRAFRFSDLCLLAAAVQSCKFITAAKADDLVLKLSSLASRHQAKKLPSKVHVRNRIPDMGDSVFAKLDKLQAAIAADRRVSFRNKEEKVVMSPFGIIVDGCDFYLFGKGTQDNGIRYQNIADMTDIVVTCIPRDRT